MPATNPLDNPESWVDLRSPFDVTRPTFGGLTNNFDIFNYDQEPVAQVGLGNELFPAYGITEQDVLNYFNTPGLTPQDAVATMQQYGIQPEDIAGILGLTPEDARSQYTAALTAAPTTTAPAAVTPPAATAPVTPPPADSNIVMDAVREVGKVFDAGLKAFGDIIGGFDLSAVILNPVNPKATVVFGPPSGSPVTVIGNMPTSKAPIGVNTGIPALDAVIASVFAGKNSNRPLGEVIQDAVYEAVSDATGVDVKDIIKGTETGLEGVVDQVEKVVTGLDTNVAEVEAVQRPAIIADWYDKNKDLPDEEIAKVMDDNNVTTEEMANAIGEDPAVVKQKYDDAKVIREIPATEANPNPPPLAPIGSVGPSGSETNPNLVRVDDPNSLFSGPTKLIDIKVNPDAPLSGPVKLIDVKVDPNAPLSGPTKLIDIKVNPDAPFVGPIKVNPPAPIPDPIDPPVIIDPFPSDPRDPIEPPIEPLPPAQPPQPPTPDPEPEPVPIIPPPITPPDGPPPPRTPPASPDLTPVIGGALGGLFGAISPTPITDSIFAPEKVKFNRLPLDITNTLFGGFRR